MENKNNLKAYDLRVNKGMLPTIDIAGHTFYVDIRMDMLRPKDDFLSKGIVFSDIGNYYDEDKRACAISCNPKTHEFQEINKNMITEFPKDLISVSFPHESILDPVGYNRLHYSNLKETNLRSHFKAQCIARKETFLVCLIESNLRSENQTDIRQETKRKGRKM